VGPAGPAALAGPAGPAGPAGADGARGLDGRDGLGFEDVSFEFDGQRTLTAQFARGDRETVVPIRLAVPMYLGVFAAGRTYGLGDLVTYGGSVWIAAEETADTPGTSAAWQLAVKRGRDGKDGKAGPAGPAGPRGDTGEPGPSRY
jgi:integrin beta 3